MFKVIGVILDSSKNVYYFSTQDLELVKGLDVLVETENGKLLGLTTTDSFMEKEDNLVFPLKNVVRIATKEDLEKRKTNEEEAKRAIVLAQKIADELKLDMRFIDGNYTFDKKQLFLAFLADNRVDFRELAKKLAQKCKTRIELRQIGVRDKAKRIGGIGPCGLFLCCNAFLTDFNSVSINMAKNQMLALNPSKINGVCGRLLCCLNYEDETYTYLKKNMPHVGMFVQTKDYSGKVVSVNIFKGTYRIDCGAKGIIELNADRK